jgi:WD40 repeat protein
VHAIDSLKELASVNIAHHGQISCVQGDSSHKVGCSSPYRHCIVTGGIDGTCRVWAPSDAFTPSQLVNLRSATSMLTVSLTQEGSQSEGGMAEESFGSSVAPQEPPAFLLCLHILCGHETPVLSIFYSSEMDLVLSGSRGGLLCLHSARKGKFIRSIGHMSGSSVDGLLLTSAGYIVAHSKDTLSLRLFWINGQALATVSLSSRIECMIPSANSTSVIVCGGRDGVLSFRTVWDLAEVYSIPGDAMDASLQMDENEIDAWQQSDPPSKGAVKSLWFSEDFQYLFVGYEDGSFSVAMDAESKWKMLSVAS